MSPDRGTADDRDVWRAAALMGQIGLGPYDLPEAALRAVVALSDTLSGTVVQVTQRDPASHAEEVLAASHPEPTVVQRTYPLTSVDGRITGHLHLAAGEAGRGPLVTLPDGEATDQLLTVLAGFIDWMHGPPWVTTRRPDGEHCAIVTDRGEVLPIPSRATGPFLVPGSGLVITVVAERPPVNQVSRLWWVDPQGAWHRVGLHGGPQGTLVTMGQPGLPYGLSGREMEVVTLVAAGHTNAQIASRLFITESTVAKHVEHSLRKTGSSSRAVLSVRAVLEGLTIRPLPGSLPA
jgi:DNA-binding CsgD family transcriptional regulator